MYKYKVFYGQYFPVFKTEYVDFKEIFNVLGILLHFTTQKIKLSINDFFSKCDQIRRKSLMKNFIFCVVKNFVFGNFPPSQRLAPIINKFLKFRIFHSKLISSYECDEG